MVALSCGCVPQQLWLLIPRYPSKIPSLISKVRSSLRPSSCQEKVMQKGFYTDMGRSGTVTQAIGMTV